MRTMMTGKIHRATVTQADLHYVGSITVDADLLAAADILPGQQVDVVDVDQRRAADHLRDRGRARAGQVCVNGAAAHLVHPGDVVILIAYGQLSDARGPRPTSRASCSSTSRTASVDVGDDPGQVPDDWSDLEPSGLPLAERGSSGRAGDGARRRPGRGRPDGPAWPRALAAPAPGWTVQADAVVVGSGIAGLTAALELRTRVPRVLLVTKDILASGSTVLGAGRHRRGAGPVGLARRAPAGHPRRRCGPVRPARRRGAGHRGPGARPRAGRARRRVRPGARRHHLADPRGRPPRGPDRARGRRRHGCGDLPRARRADRGGARRPGHRGHRARARPRRADRPAGPRRPARPRVRRDAARDRRGPARRRRRGAGPRGRAGDRRHRPGVPLVDQPVAGDRRRHRRRRCAPARCSATSSSCSSTRRCCGSAPA